MGGWGRYRAKIGLHIEAVVCLFLCLWYSVLRLPCVCLFVLSALAQLLDCMVV